MGTRKNRARYDRSKLRYPSDLTDDEWGLVEPLIPPGKTGGGKRTVIMREVVNGLMYILSAGCQWRAIPKDLPPKSSVYDYFDLWTYDGTLERIHYALYEQCRERAQREASPTAAIIDSQSVKSAEKDLPPKSSVYDYFALWTYDGILERIHYALYEQCRERAQREASPTAAIIDSQSVKSAEKGGRALIRTGTMRVRRSRARSGTFLSTH